MKTIEQITQEIHQYRPCSRAQLYRWLTLFDIKPAAANQRPQRYPDDAAEKILKELGFLTEAQPAPASPKPMTSPAILSMDQLRAARAASAGKRGAK